MKFYFVKILKSEPESLAGLEIHSVGAAVSRTDQCVHQIASSSAAQSRCEILPAAESNPFEIWKRSVWFSGNNDMHVV